MNAEKRAQLKELVGGDESLLTSLLAGIEQRDKAAQESAVAYKEIAAAGIAGAALKSAVETASPIYTAPDGTPGIIVGGTWVALKAATEKAPMPPEEMIEAGVTELEDGEAELELEADDGGDEGNLLTPGEIGQIAAAVAAELMGHLDGIAAKMASVDEELKGRGYQRMKEASEKTLPAVLKELQALKTTVNELAGLAPARGYRPTEDGPDLEALIEAALKADDGDATVLDETDPLAGALRFAQSFKAA